METYIQISQLNDFVFCPKSIYFHNLYGRYNQTLYHELPQTAGKLKHERIDTHKYSSAKRYLQGLEIYSEQYNLCGKLDLYDTEEYAIIERKNRIKKIYDGYIFQIHAQYFCLTEMNYSVEKLYLHSLADNQRYPIELPTAETTAKFAALIAAMNAFDPAASFTQNPEKCHQCIYRHLCDSYSL